MIFLEKPYQNHLNAKLSDKEVSEYLYFTKKAFRIEKLDLEHFAEKIMQNFDFDLLAGLRKQGTEIIQRFTRKPSSDTLKGFNAYLVFLEEYMTERLVLSVLEGNYDEEIIIENNEKPQKPDVSDVFFYENIESIFGMRRN